MGLQLARLDIVGERESQIQIGTGQGTFGLLRPLHQHQPRTGKDVVEAGVEPLVWRREPI